MFIQLKNSTGRIDYINYNHIVSVSEAVYPPNDKCKSFVMLINGKSVYYQQAPEDIIDLIEYARGAKYSERLKIFE